MKKRILSLIVTLCMVISLSTVFSASVMAAPPTLIKDKNLVAIGDSITTGCGLPDYNPASPPYAPGSFVELAAKKGGFTPINQGLDGITAEMLNLGLADALAHPADAELNKAIRGATAISLTIGGNDLLGALISEIGQELKIDPTLGPDAYKKKVMEIIAPVLMAQNPTQEQIVVLGKIGLGVQAMATKMPELTAAFQTNFEGIIAMIKQMNPHAMIVAQTIPNPYGKIPGFGAALEAGVQAFNTVINTGKTSGAYHVADTYTVLGAAVAAGTSVFNSSDPKTPLDPHPNAAGHAMIADKVGVYLADAPALLYVEVAWFGDETENTGKKIRPASLEIQLYKDNGLYGEPTTINEALGWEFLFTFPANDTSVWTADILAVPAGYTKELKVAQDGNITIVYTHTHTWDNGVVTTEPTVDKEGVRTFTCTVCDKTRTEPIAKLPATPSQTPSTTPSQTPSATPSTAAPVASKPAQANSPKTADNTNVLPFALLGIGSLTAIAIILKKRKTSEK